MITQKRPTAIGQLLTIYKRLALSKTREHVKGLSGPCGHCAHCGNYGKQEINGAMYFTNNEQNGKLRTQPKLHMRKLWHLCDDMCYLLRTIRRSNQKQIFHVMVVAPQ